MKLWSAKLVFFIMILRVAHMGLVGTATEWHVYFFIYAALLAHPPSSPSTITLESALTEASSYCGIHRKVVGAPVYGVRCGNDF